MSEQKKINLSALNKKANEEKSPKTDDENQTVVSESSKENENNRKTSKKVTEKMKKIINWEFIAKTEEDAENKMKEWKEQILEKNINTNPDFWEEIKEENNIINFENKLEENKDDIELPPFIQEGDLEEKVERKPVENKQINKIVLPTLKEEPKKEEIIEEKKVENIVEEKTEEIEEKELFTNYKSDFDNLANQKNDKNDSIESYKNQDSEFENTMNMPKQKRLRPTTIILIYVLIILIIALAVVAFLYKDKIKELILWKEIIKETNINSWEIEKTNTGNIKESNSWKLETKKENLNIKWIDFEIEVLEQDSGKIYLFEWNEFKDMSELEKVLEEKAKEIINEKRKEKIREINEKMKQKIKDEFLKKD